MYEHTKVTKQDCDQIKGMNLPQINRTSTRTLSSLVYVKSRSQSKNSLNINEKVHTKNTLTQIMIIKNKNKCRYVPTKK